MGFWVTNSGPSSGSPTTRNGFNIGLIGSSPRVDDTNIQPQLNIMSSTWVCFKICDTLAQHKTIEMASLIRKAIDLRRRVPSFKAQPRLAEAPNHSKPTKVMTQNGILGCSPWSNGHTNILWKSLTAAWKSISKHLWPSVWWFETNVFMKTSAIVICNQDLMALAALALGKTGSYEKIWTHGTHKLLQNQCHNGGCRGFRKKSTRSNAGMLLFEENSSCCNIGVTTFHDNRRYTSSRSCNRYWVTLTHLSDLGEMWCGLKIA